MSFGFVQVEVSTRCQLNCLMCPKSCFDDWIANDMSMKTFRLIPFKKFRYAHLQGWGEPLLNPNISEMIELAAEHCRVGLTTNGVLLERNLDALMKLDLLAVSVASANPKVQSAVRGFSLEKLRRGIKLVSENRKRKRPKIVIATMMLKSTIDALPEMVDFAIECGADEIVANNLDYIPSKELLGQEVFGEKVNAKVEEIIGQTEKKAKDAGIKFVAKPRVMGEAIVCAENPVDNCFVTVDGRIAPCVYLHLPTESGAIVRYFKGKKFEVAKLYFSSMMEWERSGIRDIYRRRLQALYKSLPLDFPTLPEFCMTCYKAWSV